MLVFATPRHESPMKIGIIGLPRSGKTTLLGALTGATCEDQGYAREANRATIPVPEPRLDRLYEIFQPKKKTPASIDFVDLPGLETTKPGEKSTAPQVLAQVRQVDCLLLVLRAFEKDADPHPSGSIDPLRDLDTLRNELVFADLEIVSNRLERIAAQVKKPVPDREELLAEQESLLRVQQVLEEGGHLRDLEFPPQIEKRLKSYGLLRRKPEVLVINLGENEISNAPTHETDDSEGAPRIALSAEAEKEIQSLEEEDRDLFMEEYGLTELTTPRIIRASYGACGLISFFTGGGPDEVRAWTLPLGALAPQAGGAIHSDLERGFIRAEVVHYDDLDRCGDIKSAKAEGVWRLEGKEYSVADGDVITIRFST